MTFVQDITKRNHGQDQALAITMQRVVDELGIMVDQATLLDQQIGKLTIQTGSFHSRTLQGMDRLRQELEGLHEFVQRLTETLGPDGLCSPDIAADALKLRAQSLRLRGLPPESGSDDLW